jgi:ketol-acid reductoisomerase
MVRAYYEKDASLEPLRGKTIAIVGYGSQGRAQALNMRDSGQKVVVGLRPEGKSWKAARAEGFEPVEIRTAAREGDIVAILTPDTSQPEIYKTDIAGEMKKGKTLYFSHGFNIHFKQIVPPKDIDVIMVAPKSPGLRLRELYEEGFGVPALIAVAQDSSGKARETALAIGRALGCARAGMLETTFGDETESDLIGEQTVLVGGLMELIKNGFEVLTEAGYPPELAYFEACNEAKLIMDLIYERGLVGMLRGVSDTAKYGGLTVGPKVIDQHVKANMKKAVPIVKNGEFAKQWVTLNTSKPEALENLIKQLEKHPLEVVGRQLRRMAGLEK